MFTWAERIYSLKYNLTVDKGGNIASRQRRLSPPNFVFNAIQLPGGGKYEAAYSSFESRGITARMGRAAAVASNGLGGP